MENIENKLLEWKSFVDSVDVEGAFHLLELAGQFNHISNGMHQFERQFICHFLEFLQNFAHL